MSARADYLRWRQKPAVGCVFARLIAGRPDDFGQRVEEVPSRGTPAQVARNVDALIVQLETDRTISAAAILLPGITTLEALTRFALALPNYPRWHVTTSGLAASSAGSLVAVHIVRDIPIGATTCPSEALVLGPFTEFPPTRRSPVPALEIYIGEPMPHDPKSGRPTTKANLAHMDLPSLTASAFRAMWKKSEEGRLTSLGKEDIRAKAKVSFVIPLSLAQQLGCA